MATTYTCDACSRTGSVNKFEYLCHIDEMLKDPKEGPKRFYVDREFNAVSGRRESVDLCNECYNRVMIATVQMIRQIQRSTEHSSQAPVSRPAVSESVSGAPITKSATAEPSI